MDANLIDSSQIAWGEKKIKSNMYNRMVESEASAINIDYDDLVYGRRRRHRI